MCFFLHFWILGTSQREMFLLNPMWFCGLWSRASSCLRKVEAVRAVEDVKVEEAGTFLETGHIRGYFHMWGLVWFWHSSGVWEHGPIPCRTETEVIHRGLGQSPECHPLWAMENIQMAECGMEGMLPPPWNGPHGLRSSYLNASHQRWHPHVLPDVSCNSPPAHTT